MLRVLVLFILFFYAFPGFSQEEKTMRIPLLSWECLVTGIKTASSPIRQPGYLEIKAGDCIKLPIRYEKLTNFNFENQLRPDYDPASSIPPQKIFSPLRLITPVISSDRYAKQLGFICRNELLLDKLTPVPLRFRLGSLDYVNWMEQKPNALRKY